MKTELEFLEYLITPNEEGHVFDIDSYAIKEIQERIKQLKKKEEKEKMKNKDWNLSEMRKKVIRLLMQGEITAYQLIERYQDLDKEFIKRELRLLARYQRGQITWEELMIERDTLAGPELAGVEDEKS